MVEVKIDLLTTLGKQSDSDKTDTIKALDVAFTGEQVVKILGVYKSDSYRIDGLKLLKRFVDFGTVIPVLRTFQKDTYVSDAVDVLEYNFPSMATCSAIDIIETAQKDTYKEDILKKIVRRIEKLDSKGASEIVRCFSGDSYKTDCVELIVHLFCSPCGDFADVITNLVSDNYKADVYKHFKECVPDEVFAVKMEKYKVDQEKNTTVFQNGGFVGIGRNCRIGNSIMSVGANATFKGPVNITQADCEMTINGRSILSGDMNIVRSGGYNFSMRKTSPNVVYITGLGDGKLYINGEQHSVNYSQCSISGPISGISLDNIGIMQLTSTIGRRSVKVKTTAAKSVTLTVSPGNWKSPRWEERNVYLEFA